MVEMVYTTDLKSVAHIGLGGSNPPIPTRANNYGLLRQVGTKYPDHFMLYYRRLK